MVEGALAAQDYRSAIWPLFAWATLAFAVGFVALVGLGLALASRVAGADPQRIVILMSFAVCRSLGAVGQLIVIGAAQVTFDQAYCDCGFKNEEIVSQIWGQMLLEGASGWLVSSAASGGDRIVGVDLACADGCPRLGHHLLADAIGLIATVVVELLESRSTRHLLLPATRVRASLCSASGRSGSASHCGTRSHPNRGVGGGTAPL
jgi:hypothetical protein